MNAVNQSIKWHPAANIFPMLDDDDLKSLADDIRDHGLRDPILLFDGMVLDGRNRWMACKLAGVKPKTAEFSGTKEEALSLVWSKNFQRRHLDKSQAAIADAKRAKLDKEYAAELEKVRKTADKGGRPKKETVSTNCDSKRTKAERNAASTDHKRAQSVGTNRTYIAAADKIVSHRPDLADKIEKGKLTIPQAKAEMKREEKREELQRAEKRVADHKSDMPKWTILNMDVVEGLESVSENWGPANLIFADPPYNIGVDYGNGSKSDKLSDHDYMHWCSEWIERCVDCLDDNGSMWVMIGDEYAAEYAIELKEYGLTIRNWVKWYETFGVNCSDKFNRSSRHLFYCVKNPKKFTFNPDAVMRASDRQTKYGDKRASPTGKIWDDVWQIPRLTGTCKERIPDFPTQLPLALVSAVVGCCSMPGDLVVDPFCGSGTTGVASIQSKRKFVGIEKQESFVDLANKRLTLS